MPNVIVWNDAISEQKVSYKISPQPGSLMSLRSIGGQLEAIARMLEVDNPRKEKCLLAGIEMDADGSITFNVIVAPKKRRPDPSPPPARGRDDADG